MQRTENQAFCVSTLGSVPYRIFLPPIVRAPGQGGEVMFGSMISRLPSADSHRGPTAVLRGSAMIGNMNRRSLPLVALLMLTGCSGPDGSAPQPGLCASGQTTFETASTRALLTGVTPTLEAATKGMTLDAPYVEINTRTAEVRADARVPGEEIYRQLAAGSAEERPLVTYGTVHHPASGESVIFDGTGRFVSYEWIRAVSVPFAYACDGTTSEGTVTSWEAAGHSGVIDCDEPDAAKDAGDAAEVIRQVRELRCDGS